MTRSNRQWVILWERNAGLCAKKYRIKTKKKKLQTHKLGYAGLDILKYIDPGLLVRVGFVDPGN